MKLKISNLLTALAAVLALTLTARAQEEIPVPESQEPARRELNLNEDKALIYEKGTHGSSAKDSTQSSPRLIAPSSHVVPTRNTKPDASKKDSDEDALSFNFLYYMLQKFKLADMVDQN